MVTGHKGFIGRRIYNELLDKGYVVDGFDVGDDFPDGRYEYIVHFAARTLIRKSLEAPYEYFEDGLGLTMKFLEKARIDNSILIFPTSGSIDKPTNPYSLAKKNAVEWIEMYRDLFNVKSHILKLFNIYGEKSGKGILYFFCEAAIKGTAVTIYGDGTHKRDFVYVHDVARAVRGIVEEDADEGIHEFGTGIGTSVNDLKAIVEKVSGKKINADFKPYILDEAEELFAKTPYIKTPLTLEEGIKRVLSSIE